MITCNGNIQADAIVVGIDKTKQLMQHIPKEDATLIYKYLETRSSNLAFASVQVFHCVCEERVKVYFLIGQENGMSKTRDFSDYTAARQVMALAMKEHCQSLAVYVDTLSMRIETLIDGLLDRNYEFIQYMKNKERCVVEKINVITSSLQVKEINSLCYKYMSMYEGIYKARDLVNMPPNELTPRKFVDLMATILQGGGGKVEYFNKWSLEKMKMGGISAVGKGSMNPPQLVVIQYLGDPDNPDKLGLIGKGVTYDSGGLSLKSAANQEFMKDDMAGAATVVGIIKALQYLKYPVNVMGVIPLVENIPSSMSYHVDDIITMYDGTTVEIKNTDAEGRLILADALSYAQEKGATRLIDLATLTGACVTALGTIRSGMVGNNQEWMNQFFCVAEQNHEKVWQFPFDAEYGESLKSQVADLKNIGGRDAGAITAGMFLNHFVRADIPWLHVDIAGTAFCEQADKTGFYGATGVGIKSILELLRSGSIEKSNQ